MNQTITRISAGRPNRVAKGWHPDGGCDGGSIDLAIVCHDDPPDSHCDGAGRSPHARPHVSPTVPGLMTGGSNWRPAQGQQQPQRADGG